MKNRASDGRHLQVIFVLVPVEFDEFEELELHERLELQEGELSVRVIHARDLSAR